MKVKLTIYNSKWFENSDGLLLLALHNLGWKYMNYMRRSFFKFKD